MFVRFAARLRDCDSRVPEGIFIVAYRLYEDGDLAAYERAHLHDCLGWFESNLKVPNAFARARERAVYWFKSSAESQAAPELTVDPKDGMIRRNAPQF